MEKIRVGILGATGYGGKETIKILHNHPIAEITMVSASDASIGVNLSDLFPEFRGISDYTIEKSILSEFIKRCDVVMHATPNGITMQNAKELLDAGVKVIDYSGDFRLQELDNFETTYKMKHTSPDLIKDAAFGMSELFENEVKDAMLLSNPGCFATAVILANAPLVKNNLVEEKAVAVAISGTSGAGRKAMLPFLYSEMEGTVKPYKTGVHQHEPEINEVLNRLNSNSKIDITFAPQVGPFSRGILNTTTLMLKKPMTLDEVHNIYSEFYKNRKFVRIMAKGLYPEIKNVVNTNFCDIGIYVKDDGRIIVYSVIDNLGKGLSGQAIQNMNLMFGLDEEIGQL